MKKLLYAFLLVLISGFVFGCSKPLEVGRVSEKVYEEENLWVEKYTTSHKIGDVRWSSTHYDLRKDDEDWIFIIEGWNSREKLVQEKHYVSKSVYESYQIGDRYVVPQNPIKSDSWTKVRKATEEDKETYPIR